MHEKFAAAIIGIPSTSISADQIDTWAKIASSRFIKEAAPLNDTIRKIAQDNDLNPNFIERICESANLQTHTALLPREPEKRASFAFPLADAKVVTASLRPSGGPPKKIISDYTRPPSAMPGGGPSLEEMFGVNGSNGCGHQGGDVPEKQRLVILIQKTAAQRQRVYDALVNKTMEIEHAEKQANHQIKQAMLQGASLEEIHAAACSAGLGDESAELLPKTAQLMKRHFLVSEKELEKVAFKAPESLIDRDVPVTIVNGRNPILASIDALREYKSSAHTYRLGLMGIDDELKVLKQRLKEL